MGSNWQIDDNGMCFVCGHFAEDKNLHIFKLHNERHAMNEENAALRLRLSRLERVREHLDKCVMCQNIGTDKCSTMDYLRDKALREVE